MDEQLRAQRKRILDILQAIEMSPVPMSKVLMAEDSDDLAQWQALRQRVPQDWVAIINLRLSKLAFYFVARLCVGVAQPS